MTRANDLEQNGLLSKTSPQDEEVTPAEDRARVSQARESVQDAIGKIIGEPLGERPEDDADRNGKDDARKPVQPSVKRQNRIERDGAD